MEKEERKIGRKAAQLLKNSLQRTIKGRFAGHLSGGKNSLSKAVGSARYRKSERQDGTVQSYLKGIAVRMVRYGYIQHYGITSGTVRAGGERTRHRPRETKYRFKAHLYSRGLKEKAFIDKALSSSGAIEYLSQELPKVRGEEILLMVDQELTKRD